MILFEWNWILLYLAGAMALGMLPLFFFLKRLQLIALYLAAGYFLLYAGLHAYRPSIKGEIGSFSIPADAHTDQADYQIAARPFPAYPDESFTIDVMRPKQRTGRWLECDLFVAGETAPRKSLFGGGTSWRIQAGQGDAFHGRLSCGLQTRAGIAWRKAPTIQQDLAFAYLPTWYRPWTYALPVIVIILSLALTCSRLLWVRFLERQAQSPEAKDEVAGAESQSS
ncbi:MAG: hypothetical protein NXI24_24705 [bacterium]|nr:hypothetical protein [bacterium]